MATDDNASLRFANQEAWLIWLEQHHAHSASVWLEIGKKNCGGKCIYYADALDAALCYGWIDGQKRKGTDEVWLQRFSRRGKTSIWSKINREKAIVLIETECMQASGLAAIERAKQGGQWDAAYSGAATADVPDDLAEALRRSKRANAFFQKLNSVNRYAILFRLQTAKKAETRAARLQKFVGMLERGETIYPQG